MTAVEALLDCDTTAARQQLGACRDRFPIVVTDATFDYLSKLGLEQV